MATNRTNLFDGIANGAAWDAGVVFNRTNALPLDKYSVFKSVADATTYAATNAVAYPGQVIAVVPASGVVDLYKIESDGSISKVGGDVAADLSALTGRVVTAEGKLTTLEGAETVTGSVRNIAKSYADTKVGSVGAKNASVEIGGTTTAPTVGVKLDTAANNALKLATGGLRVDIPEAPVYAIRKETLDGSSEYSAVYHLTKDGVDVDVPINIPKDMVVSSGEVVTNPSGKPAGTYIVLTLANATNDKLYINVGTLIEYVTSGSAAGDMVVVAIDDTTHKVTATITDGTVTKAKLASAVQTSLGLADSALQSVKVAGTTLTKTSNEITADAIASALNLSSYVTKTVADNTYVAKVDGLANIKSVDETKGLSLADDGSIGLNVNSDFAFAEPSGTLMLSPITANNIQLGVTAWDMLGGFDIDSSSVKTYVDNAVSNAVTSAKLQWGEF